MGASAFTEGSTIRHIAFVILIFFLTPVRATPISPYDDRIYRPVRTDQAGFIHVLDVTLEHKDQLGLSVEQIAELQSNKQRYDADKAEHIQLVTRLNVQLEASKGEKRNAIAERIEKAHKEFNMRSALITAATFEIIGPSRTDTVRSRLREIYGVKESGRVRPDLHPLFMALVVQNRLELTEEQVAEFQSMWYELIGGRDATDRAVGHLEAMFASARETGAEAYGIGGSQEWLQEELQQRGADLAKLTDHVFNSLRTSQRIMLYKEMLAYDRRKEVQLVFEKSIKAELIAFALELQEKIGLEERQVARLKLADAHIKYELDQMVQQSNFIERDKAEFQEAGNWTDKTASVFRHLEDVITRARDGLRYIAHKILADALNSDQLSKLEKLMYKEL